MRHSTASDKAEKLNYKRNVKCLYQNKGEYGFAIKKDASDRFNLEQNIVGDADKS
jgi:hypothetical protein